MASARYLSSEEDRETVACFLDFHETKESPRKMQKSVMDLQVSGHVAQSESLNALS